jgi:hypothetical protein
MSDIPASEPVLQTVKVVKPNIVGVITLVSGERLEFNDYISYYAARAFYSKLVGSIKLAIVGVDYPSRVVDANHPQFMLAPQMVAAKAA